jgi:uncharacterized protein (TIGR03000 family)
MSGRVLSCLATSAVALATVLIVVEPVTAQYRGRSRGSYWNSQFFGGNPGYFSGQHSSYYGGNYGSWYYGGGYGSYGPQYYGLGSNTGGYGSYYYQSSIPQYQPDTYGSPASLNAIAPASGQTSTYPPEDEKSVRITVRVSPGAEVWFDGKKTTQTGSNRQFVSPAIHADCECSYEIRARWMEGTKEVDQTRKVWFHAGDRVTVNFMTPASQGADVNGKRGGFFDLSPGTEKSDRSPPRGVDRRNLPATANDIKPPQSKQR